MARDTRVASAMIWFMERASGKVKMVLFAESGSIIISSKSLTDIILYLIKMLIYIRVES
jgi:hypothetical protein